MFPNNRTSSYPQLKENQLFPSLTLLDGLEPQKIEIGTLQQANSEVPSKQKNTTNDSEKETDLIDLMDDLCLTPHTLKIDKEKQITDYQIKMLDEFLSTTGSNYAQKSKKFTLEQDKEFQMFCDRYEAVKKSDTAVNKVQSGKEEACASNIYASNYIGTPKILVPMLEKVHIEENLKANEDLIDELLLEKNLENRLLRNPFHNFKEEATKNHNLKFSIPSHNNMSTDPQTENYTVMTEIETKNCVYFTDSKLDDKAFHMPMSKNTSETNTVNLNNHILTPNKEESLKSYPNTNINELVTKHNIKYLEAIKKDEKKRSLVKSEAEKLHLTPGPTLYEKSVFLPQAMQRLTNRKKAAEELSNMRRKLILDSGPSQYKPAECIPTVLRVNPSAKTYEPLKEKISLATQLSPVTYATSKSNQLGAGSTKDADVAASKFDQLPPMEVAGLNHSIVKTNEHIRRGFIPVPVEELRAIRREQNLSGFQVLKDDCNKDRYVNFATSCLFEDFINGK